MSEKSLNQLIDSIKNEGILAAKQTYAELISNAKAEADRIVKAAEEKRTAIIAKAEQEAKSMIDKGEAAFIQAGRDYSISVRNDIIKLLQGVLGVEVNKNFTSEVVKSAILKVVHNVGSQTEVHINPEDAKDLADFIHSKIGSSEVPRIVEDQNLFSGFTVSKKDEGWTFQITPEEVTSALQTHLNSYWVDILNKEME